MLYLLQKFQEKMMANLCPRYSYALITSLPFVPFIVVLVIYEVFCILKAKKVRTDFRRVLLRMLYDIHVLYYTLQVVI